MTPTRKIPGLHLPGYVGGSFPSYHQPAMTNADPESRPATPERDLGPQPIAGILDQLELDNHALVKASSEQLTHKMVSKARKGRRLTSKVKNKVTRALNRALAARGETDGNTDTAAQVYHPKDLFDY